MSLFPVALALFYRRTGHRKLEIWVQRREDDGPFHGLLEFPGGGIEPGEAPLAAAVREVEEEVGINVSPDQATFMGTYASERKTKTVLLYVFLFPDQPSLLGKGRWLEISSEKLSSLHQGLIPPPNHQIIDDLFRSLYDSNP